MSSTPTPVPRMLTAVRAGRCAMFESTRLSISRRKRGLRCMIRRQAFGSVRHVRINNPIEVQNTVPALRTRASATPVAAAKPALLKHYFSAAFVDANRAGDESKDEVYYLCERLNDVGLSHSRRKTQHPERDIHFKHARLRAPADCTRSSRRTRRDDVCRSRKLSTRDG